MKTMTEQECRYFVMSGFIPTSNEDIADIQDCFNHQSVDFHLGLLMDVETHANAERLMRACLHSDAEVDALVQQSEDILRRLGLRKQYATHLTYLENKVASMRVLIAEADALAERYNKYMN